MPKPSILLTGEQAGKWYIDTLKAMKMSQPSFDWETVQVDFDPINAILPHKLEEAARLLEPYFEALEKRKQPYILANITLHEAIQHFSFIPKSFISMAQIFEKTSQRNLGDVAVLGTKYTMNHDYISSFLPNSNIIRLPENTQNQIEGLRKTYFNSNDKKLAKLVFSAIEKMKIDTYIIACTELAVAFSDSQVFLQTVNIPFLQCKFLTDTQSRILYL